MESEEAVYQAVIDGLLEIDEEGRVWRVAVRQLDRHTGKDRATRVMVRPVPRRRAESDNGRYLYVPVMRERKRNVALAHRLVWRHFNGPIPVGLTINHKDASGDTRDNRPGNLELATHKEQSQHMREVLGVIRKGEGNPAAKLAEVDARRILERSRAGESTTTIARGYSAVGYETVRAVVKRRTWRHL